MNIKVTLYHVQDRREGNSEVRYLTAKEGNVCLSGRHSLLWNRKDM